MRMLVLETMERFGSVALFDGEQLCESVSLASLAPPQRSAQSLLPAVRAALEKLSWRASDIGVVAVVTGPGSFTGLRVGVTAAKCFAYATGAKVIAVPAHIAIATHACQATLCDKVSEIIVAIDAQRGEAVVQRFSLPNADSDNLPVALSPARRISEVTLREELTVSQSRSVVITGSALTRWRVGLSTCGVCLDEPFWSPTAVSAGHVALSLWRRGETVSWSELSPVYSRPAAAEELAAQR